ncbi:hypothetical protein ACR6C2_12905 [Streptomyces sp. INA 01156]
MNRGGRPRPAAATAVPASLSSTPRTARSRPCGPWSPPSSTVSSTGPALGAVRRTSGGTTARLGTRRARAALGEAGWVDAPDARGERLIRTVRDGLADVPRCGSCSCSGTPRRASACSPSSSAGTAPASPRALSAEYGIGVRDGLFRAHPLPRALLGGARGPGRVRPGATSGERPFDAIRVSFGRARTNRWSAVRAVREPVRDGAAVELPHRSTAAACRTRPPEPGRPGPRAGGRRRRDRLAGLSESAKPVAATPAGISTTAAGPPSGG